MFLIPTTILTPFTKLSEGLKIEPLWLKLEIEFVSWELRFLQLIKLESSAKLTVDYVYEIP